MKDILHQLIILILAMIVFSSLTSCGGSTSAPSKVGGKDGIELSFLKNMPPSIIFIDGLSQEIDIVVEAYNKGQSGAVVESYFEGYDPDLISIGELEGIEFSEDDGNYKTRYNLQGGYESAETTMEVKSSIITESYGFDLRLVYCYDYVTQASVQVCVDPTPNKDTEEDSCTPGTVSSGGQGGPVSIDSVNVESMQGKVRLKLNIKDHSGGEVIEAGTECSDDRRAKKGIVSFTTPKLGEEQGTCVAEDSKIKLADDGETLVCTFNLDEKQSAYETILFINLEYRIRDSIEKNIKIIKENYDNQ